MIELPVKEEWIGKTLIELDLRKKKQINVVAVRDVDGEVYVNFEPDRPLEGGMSMFVTVDRNNIAKLVN